MVLPVMVRASPCRTPCASRIFITCGMPPAACNSVIDVFAGRLQIAEDWDARANGLEIVDGERDVGGVGDGQQMQDGVGRAAGGHDHGDGVLERLAGHDLARQNLLTDGVG